MTESLPPRPGDEGGAASTPLVAMHHDGLDADAEVAKPSVDLWESSGWSQVNQAEAGDDAPPDDES